MARTSDSTSSTEAAASRPAGRSVLIGRVAGAHGLRGWLRVRVFGDVGDALRAGLVITLVGESPHEYRVARVAPGRIAGEVRLALEGVDARAEAEALRGARVWLSADQLAPLPRGEWWGHELVGCRVEGEDGAPVGVITGIWETGAPDVLVVAADDGREHLVPAALLRDVDAAGRRAVIEVLPGLLEND
jgi:16S rRNA processing protein RimM